MEMIYNNNNELAGNSEAITNISRAIKLLEGRDFKVALISGEVGTQKGTASAILHSHSVRSDKPLLTIDCSTASGAWVERELESNEPGVLANHKGILCLQNIERLSLSAQSNLLRLLDDPSQRHNISLIALTSADLKKAVKENKFSLEFYEYLSRFHIHMPALRERIGDISPLSKKILKDFSAAFDTKMNLVEPEAVEIFSKYNWPGNVRQFRGMLEQAALYYPKEPVFKTDFIPHYLNALNTSNVVQVATDMRLPKQGVVLEELEKSLLKQALEQMLGNQSRAARLLGISRFALRYRMEKYGLFPKTKEDILAAASDKWNVG